MLRRFYIGTLAAAGLLLAVSAFAAGRPAPEITPLGNVQVIPVGEPHAQSTCTIGVVGVPTTLVNYLLPPGDGYFTRIKRSDCAACTGPGGVQATIAHILLEFRTANCPVQVVVEIVGATGDPLCPVPDPTVVLCPPTAYTLTAPAGVGIPRDFAMPLPAGCCITGDAFLSITVNSVGSCTSSTTIPRLVTTTGCLACTSYNIYPGGNDELCGVGFPGNPNMSLEVDCCNVVPTMKNSWGSLKIRYRG